MASALPPLWLNRDTENSQPHCRRHGSRREYQERLNLRRAIRRPLSNKPPAKSQNDMTHDAQ